MAGTKHQEDTGSHGTPYSAGQERRTRFPEESGGEIDVEKLSELGRVCRGFEKEVGAEVGSSF